MLHIILIIKIIKLMNTQNFSPNSHLLKFFLMMLCVTADTTIYCLDIYLIRLVSRNCLRHNDLIDFIRNEFDL